jgi:hypothetical protein
VDYEKKVAVELEDDALSHSANSADPFSGGGTERRINGSQEEWLWNSNPLERLPDEA